MKAYARLAIVVVLAVIALESAPQAGGDWVFRCGESQAWCDTCCDKYELCCWRIGGIPNRGSCSYNEVQCNSTSCDGVGYFGADVCMNVVD